MTNDTLNPLLRVFVRISMLTLILALQWDVAFALELPAPDDLERQHGIRRQTVEVIEPHASTAERQQHVRYVALPLDALLTRWFGEDWKAQDAEVAFLARDGYRAVIDSPRLRNHHAYLAFGRDDGTAFTVDNLQQGQKAIALGPYYLIWDNQGVPELLRLGSYGWPYQVTRIELLSSADDKRLLPRQPNPEAVKGLKAAKEYCLTCHRIRGVGGEKFPEDLVQATCRYSDTELKNWIDDPRKLRPGTTMPELNPQVTGAARQELVAGIAGYLRALRQDDPSVCSVGAAKP